MVKFVGCAVVVAMMFVLVVAPGSEAAGKPQAGKLEFEFFLYPDLVVVDSVRSMSFCMINHGEENSLIRDQTNDDHLTLTIPLGPSDSDLEADGVSVNCGSAPPGWDCTIEVTMDAVVMTVAPLGTSVTVTAGETVLFEIVGLHVNSLSGISFSWGDQFIDEKRARKPLNDAMGVFKSEQGVIRHDDLVDVFPSQHHTRYTDEEAFEAVLDRDGHGSTLDADVVDGHEGDALEESAEIDADIAAHKAIPDAHHPRYTDEEAFQAVLDRDGHGSMLNSDLVDSLEGAALEESAEIDADISAHKAIPDAHHKKTTSFTELTDQATDAQIPDTITINLAKKATDLECTGCVGTIDLLAGAVTSDRIADGAIVDSDISPAARIQGAKIVPDFGAQDVFTMGKVGIGTLTPEAGLHVAKTALIGDGAAQVQLQPGYIEWFPSWVSHGSAIRLSNPDNVDTVRVSAGDKFSPMLPAKGGAAWLANADGTQTLFLDGDSTDGSGRITLKKEDGTSTIVLRGDTGRTITKILEITGGADLAEAFEIRGEDPVEPGMVVCIDPVHTGQLRLSTLAYDRTVAGVVSGANGLNPGLLLKQEKTIADGAYPVALTGRVWVRCDATAVGAIAPGDLLVTSHTPGHAMKATDPWSAQGAILGKAMSSLSAGKGLVLVLVTLQ